MAVTISTYVDEAKITGRDPGPGWLGHARRELNLRAEAWRRAQDQRFVAEAVDALYSGPGVAARPIYEVR